MLDMLSRWFNKDDAKLDSPRPQLRLVKTEHQALRDQTQASRDQKETVEIGAATWEAIEGEWNRGQASHRITADSCRAYLWNRLVEERDEARTVHDRMFLGALLKAVDREDLGLPHVPDTSTQLNRLLGRRAPDYGTIMRVIESDPRLVGRIWATARSARFPSPPVSLDMAIGRIGMDEIWRLSVQSAVDSIEVEPGDFQLVADRCRLHGVLVGDVTAALAKDRRGPEFLAGLLHDVGELVVLAVASRTSPAPDLVARIIAQHHAAIGVLVVSAWRLDSAIQAAIAWHHDPNVPVTGTKDLAVLVQIADIAVHGALDRRQKRQSHPELAIQCAAKRTVDPTIPLVLADRAIARLERDGVQVVPRKL